MLAALRGLDEYLTDWASMDVPPTPPNGSRYNDVRIATFVTKTPAAAVQLADTDSGEADTVTADWGQGNSSVAWGVVTTEGAGATSGAPYAFVLKEEELLTSSSIGRRGSKAAPAASQAKRGRAAKQPAVRAAVNGPEPQLSAAKQLAKLRTILAAKQDEAKLLESENLTLQRRLRMFERMVSCRNSQVERLQAIAWETPEQRAATTASLLGRPAYECWSVVTANTPVSTLRLMLKETACDVASALVAADGVVGDSMRNTVQWQTMETMMNTVSTGMARVFAVNSNMPLLSGTLMTESSVRGHADEAHWVQVVGGLQLTEDQVADAIALQSLYRGWSQQFLQERLHLSNALAYTARPNAGVCSWSCGGDQGEAASLVERLQRTVTAERCYGYLACEVFFRHLLEPVQRARVMFFSSPYACDVQAMLCAISARSSQQR